MQCIVFADGSCCVLQLEGQTLHVSVLDAADKLVCSKGFGEYRLHSLTCGLDWTRSDAAEGRSLVAIGGLDDGQVVCLHIRIPSWAFPDAPPPSREVWTLEALLLGGAGSPSILLERQELLFTFESHAAVVFAHLDAARGFVLLADAADECVALHLRSPRHQGNGAAGGGYTSTAIDLNQHKADDEIHGPTCLTVLEPSCPLHRVLTMRLTGDEGAARGDAPIAILGCASGQILWLPCSWMLERRGANGSSNGNSSSSSSSSSSSGSGTSPARIAAKNLIRRATCVLSLGLAELAASPSLAGSSHLVSVEGSRLCGVGVREVCGLLVAHDFCVPGCFAQAAERSGAGVCVVAGRVLYVQGGSLYAATMRAEGGEVQCRAAVLLSGLASAHSPVYLGGVTAQRLGAGWVVAAGVCGAGVVVLRGAQGAGHTSALRRLCGGLACAPTDDEAEEADETEEKEAAEAAAGGLRQTVASINACAGQEVRLRAELRAVDTEALQLLSLTRLAEQSRRARAAVGTGGVVGGGCVDLTGWGMQMDFAVRAGGLVVASDSTGSGLQQEASAESMRLAGSGLFLECSLRGASLAAVRALHGRHASCALVPLAVAPCGLATHSCRLSFAPAAGGLYSAAFAVPLSGRMSALGPYALEVDVHASHIDLGPALEPSETVMARPGGGEGEVGGSRGERGGCGDDCGVTVPLCRFHLPIEVVACAMAADLGAAASAGNAGKEKEGLPLGPLELSIYVPHADGSSLDPCPRTSRLVAIMQALSTQRSRPSDAAVLQAPFAPPASAPRGERGFSAKRAVVAAQAQCQGQAALECYQLRAGGAGGTAALDAQLAALTHAGCAEAALGQLRARGSRTPALGFSEGDVYSLPLAMQRAMRECAELLDALHEGGEGHEEGPGQGAEEALDALTRRLVDVYARVRSMN